MTESSSKAPTTTNAPSKIDLTAPDVEPVERHPWRFALLFVIPYFLLSMSWAGSSPMSSAPDEGDHLVKAIGIARFDIGVPYEGVDEDTPAAERNASIARVIMIPPNLLPPPPCTAFQSNQPATCVHVAEQQGDDRVPARTNMGAYPPFLYLPIGLAATLADSVGDAFFLARTAVAVLSAALLWLGLAHLIKWLGRASVTGVVIAMTPMAVYTTGVVSTSGIEITAAISVAAVVVVASRKPSTLQLPSTQVLLGVSGSALVLSRQLGVVTLAVLGLALFAFVGFRPIVDLFRRPRPVLLASVALLLTSIAALGFWEIRYDNPVNTGPLLDGDAFPIFTKDWMGFVRSGVGMFGWLDAPLPDWAMSTWMALTVGVILASVVITKRARDTVVSAGVVLAICVLAFITFSSVFYPIGAGIQGRHFLATFAICPIIAGVSIAEHATRPDSLRRFGIILGTLVGAIQFTAVFMAGQRYSVGLDGPIIWIGHALWTPTGGWTLWLICALAGSLGIAYAVFRSVGPNRHQLLADKIHTLESAAAS